MKRRFQIEKQPENLPISIFGEPQDKNFGETSIEEAAWERKSVQCFRCAIMNKVSIDN